MQIIIVAVSMETAILFLLISSNSLTFLVIKINNLIEIKLTNAIVITIINKKIKVYFYQIIYFED